MVLWSRIAFYCQTAASHKVPATSQAGHGGNNLSLLLASSNQTFATFELALLAYCHLFAPHNCLILFFKQSHIKLGALTELLTKMIRCQLGQHWL